MTPAIAETIPGGERSVTWQRALAVAAGGVCLLRFGFDAHALVAAALSVALVLLASGDLEHGTVPTFGVFAASCIVLTGNVLTRPAKANEWLFAAVAIGGGALAVAFVSRGGLAVGDAKLAFLLGAGLGWSALGALLLATLGLCAAGVFVLLRNGPAGRKATIPAAPCIALAALVTVLAA